MRVTLPSVAAPSTAAASTETTTGTTTEVSCRVVLDLASSVDLAFQVAVPQRYPTSQESLRVCHDGQAVDEVQELLDPSGTRTHVLSPGAGRLELTYLASVGQGRNGPPATAGDLLVATRPSRYAESDRLVGVAATEFGDLRGLPLAAAVRDWVHGRLAYITGSSRPTDGAVETLLAGAGVCRDYAHLVVALLRALDVPARVTSVYAPGLSPMDFHAVAEAWVEGQWVLLDATGLAPRAHMVRIATGRDAADTAWLTTARGQVLVVDLQVGAVAVPSMAVEAPGVVELP